MAIRNWLSSYPFFVSPRFPPELVLEIIQHLPFENGKSIASLRSTHSRSRDILQSYECSITRNIVRKELRHASTDFPHVKVFGLNWLVCCVRKYDVLDDIMDALSSDQNCFAVKPHNLSLVNTGLLLLYRLASYGQSEPLQLLLQTKT